MDPLSGLSTESANPIIGVTTYNRNSAGDIVLPAAYRDAVQQAGGVPVLLPPSRGHSARLLQRLDGLILVGGGDINPALYGGEDHPTLYSVDDDRDACELDLAKAALASQIPTLGICRGMQMLTIASGGSLIPHLPDVYGDRIHHRLDNPRRPTTHDVLLQSDSRLGKSMGQAAIQVVSWHHQAVKTIPACWTVVAQAEDGLVEALEHRSHPWLVAVQWHPELSMQDPVHHGLFEAFITAAATYAASQTLMRLLS